MYPPLDLDVSLAVDANCDVTILVRSSPANTAVLFRHTRHNMHPRFWGQAECMILHRQSLELCTYLVLL